MKQALLFLAVLTISCDSPNHAPLFRTTKSGCPIHQYSNTLYYFDCSNHFGNALAEFQQTHTVQSIAEFSSVTNGVGGTDGYFVVTNK